MVAKSYLEIYQNDCIILSGKPKAGGVSLVVRKRIPIIRFGLECEELSDVSRLSVLRAI